MENNPFIPRGRIQTVRLILEDGREGTFTGVAICDPDLEKNLTVREIMVSVPEEAISEEELDLVLDENTVLH